MNPANFNRKKKIEMGEEVKGKLKMRERRQESGVDGLVKGKRKSEKRKVDAECSSWGNERWKKEEERRKGKGINELR